MKLRLQGTGKYREILEKRGCGRLENTETPEKQASTQGDSALAVILPPKEQKLTLHQPLKILICL